MKILGYGMLIIALTAGTVWSQSPSDLAGTWSGFIPDEQGDSLLVVITFDEDMTYEAGLMLGGFLLTIQQGTYELSGDRIMLTPPIGDERPDGEGQEARILSLSEDEVVLSVDEDVITFVRGILEEPQRGEGSISGVVSYSGAIKEEEEILMVAIPGPLEKYEDLSPFMSLIPTLGPYTISGLPDGTYHILALVLDIEAVIFQEEWEPMVMGIYGTPLAALPIAVSGGATISDIDIKLLTQSPNTVGPHSWGQVKAVFR
jgi:hypothetical protein